VQQSADGKNPALCNTIRAMSHTALLQITLSKKIHPILDAKCNETKFSIQFH
jgi:hypothetical protein